MENKTKYGIAGLLTLLVAFGGYVTLTPEELDNAYYCPSTGMWGIFYGGISSTGLTAYPYSENKTDYVRCTNSKWVLLKTYAEEMGISVDQLISELPLPTENVSVSEKGVWGKQYLCDQIKCEEIK